MSAVATAPLRLDKWLFVARFVRRRQTAEELVAAGRIRVNGEIMTKTHRLVRPGDVVTVVTPQAVRMVRVVDTTDVRRGSPQAAAHLYETITAEA